MCVCLCVSMYVMLSRLTWILLALFKGLVDIDKSEVVALWMLELHVALGRLWPQVHRGSHKASWY